MFIFAHYISINLLTSAVYKHNHTVSGCLAQCGANTESRCVYLSKVPRGTDCDDVFIAAENCVQSSSSDVQCLQPVDAVVSLSPQLFF